MLILGDCFDEIKNIKDSSIDLILTDPPYNISRKSYFNNASENASEKMKTKYTGYKTEFGEWDNQILDFDLLFKEYYRVLKTGGTIIFFYDVWKSNIIKEIAEKNKFKQPRIGMWLKNNPVPINSKVNYLTNSKEFFFSFIKGKNPTFNSSYDNAIYSYPICHGKERLDHPTQKPLNLIIDLILKHSNEDDTVLDTFSGTGTLAEAAILTRRNFICIEKDEKYYNIMKERINQKI